MHKIIHFLFTGFFLLTALTGSATVRLPALFSDNMVLQRGMTVRIWGWADEGEGVLVNFRDQEEYTVAKNGKWCVELSSLQAGGPDVLKVSGRNAIEVTNVLVGEVKMTRDEVKTIVRDTTLFGWSNRWLESYYKQLKVVRPHPAVLPPGSASKPPALAKA